MNLSLRIIIESSLKQKNIESGIIYINTKHPKIV